MTIEITEVRNSASLQSDNLRMEVEINHPQHGWIPYGVDPADTDNTINNDEVMALIGTDFTAYVAPTQAELEAEAAAQAKTAGDPEKTKLEEQKNNEKEEKEDEIHYRKAPKRPETLQVDIYTKTAENVLSIPLIAVTVREDEKDKKVSDENTEEKTTDKGNKKSKKNDQ